MSACQFARPEKFANSAELLVKKALAFANKSCLQSKREPNSYKP